jgi:DNA polymerase delta subunit 4
MPPTRRTRTSGGPTAKGGQKALSFNQSKITKPTAPSAKEKQKEEAISTTAPAPTTASIDVGHVSSEAAVAQQAAAEIAKPAPTPEEIEAEAVTDAQIRRYWKAREAERRTPRVHQEDLGVEEKILRLFDMSSQYGVRYYFSLSESLEPFPERRCQSWIFFYFLPFTLSWDLRIKALDSWLTRRCINIASYWDCTHEALGES